MFISFGIFRVSLSYFYHHNKSTGELISPARMRWHDYIWLLFLEWNSARFESGVDRASTMRVKDVAARWCWKWKQCDIETEILQVCQIIFKGALNFVSIARRVDSTLDGLFSFIIQSHWVYTLQSLKMIYLSCTRDWITWIRVVKSCKKS